MPESEETLSQGADLTADNRFLRIVLPATFDAVRQALLHLHDRFPPLSLSEDEEGSIQIVLAEALNNIVEHAFTDMPGAIEVEAIYETTALQFRISDKGREMPDGKVPLGRKPDYPSDPTQMPEGGFGWFLIHDLSQDLSYQRAGDVNILQFRLSISPQ